MASYTTIRILKGIARFLSTALSPLLAPTYGAFLVLWVSVMCLLPIGTRVTVLLMVMGITCILPMAFIGVLHHFKVVSDKQLVKRSERVLPYCFTLLCYVAAAFYLDHIHAPQWFVMCMAGVALSCAISMIVNFTWKISAHAAGICGLVALLYQLHVQGLSAFNLYWLLIATILLAGALGSARILLRSHTVWQVLAGAANGFLSVSLMMRYFG